MKVTISSLHFKTDQKLDTFIEGKVGKLANYFEQILESEVTLRLDKDSSGENKVTEIKLDVPGGDFYVKKQSKSFEESTDLAVEALKKQLIKHKEKQNKTLNI
jgi:putative sigma-54 modulation protein